MVSWLSVSRVTPLMHSAVTVIPPEQLAFAFLPVAVVAVASDHEHDPRFEMTPGKRLAGVLDGDRVHPGEVVILSALDDLPTDL